MSIQSNRVDYINKRLLEIIEEAKTASEPMKIFLRKGYGFLLEEKKKLLKTPPDQLIIC